MEEKHKEILTKKRVDLVESVCVQNGLYTQLRARNVLTLRLENHIKLNSTPHEQVERLLDLLPTRGPDIFRRFCDALRGAGQGWVVQEYLCECSDPSPHPQPAAASPAFEKRRPLSPWNSKQKSRTLQGKRTHPYMRKLNQNFTKKESQHELESSAGLPEKISKKNTCGLASPASSSATLNSSSADVHLTDGHVDVRVEPCKRQFYEKNHLEAYPMKRNPRGLALIFNVNKIKEMDPRPGTEVDRDNLVRLLDQLYFVPTVFNDEDGLSSQEILAKAKEFSERPEHENSDCTIICLLSHGGAGYILGTDGEQVSLKEIYGFFANDKCKNLLRKPKVFIHQACRGDKKDKGVRVVDEMDGDSGDKLPTFSDMLMCYPTQEGYFAWRNPERGSWYVEALVKGFMEHAKDENIYTMLDRVNKQVSEMTSHPGEMCQMSEFTSTLCKPLYFFPGIASPADSL